MMRFVMGLCLTAAFAFAQSSTVLFEGVKFSYQRAGETKWREDKGLLALNGAQKVMLINKDNKPLFIMRYDNISSMEFDEKKSKTLTIRYGGDSAPSGMVRMELSGKWKDILETIHSQSQKPIATISPKK